MLRVSRNGGARKSAAVEDLHDMQSRRDYRELRIDKVGVRGLRFPIQVRDKAHSVQNTVATIGMFVDLPKEFKGTHMSRFIEVLNAHGNVIHVENIPDILRSLQKKLNSSTSHIEIEFPYFMSKRSPVSHGESLMDYIARFDAAAINGEIDFVLTVKAHVTTLCPCSKAIAQYGAHNQRGSADIRVRTVVRRNGSPALVWIEELIEIGEQCCSAPVYSLLKRPDERWVTMTAYNNPMFVEDVIRELTAKLKRDRRVAWFRVHVESEESIHNHNAFATLEWRRQTLGDTRTPSSAKGNKKGIWRKTSRFQAMSAKAGI